MSYAPVLDALVVYDEEGKHTKQESNAIVGCRSTKSQQTAQVTEENKYEDRSDVVDETSCIASQNTCRHALQCLIGHLQHILKCSRLVRCLFEGPVRQYRKDQDQCCDDPHAYGRCCDPEVLTK